MKLFGTDGIRDKANSGHLTPDNVKRIAIATAYCIRKDNFLPRADQSILIGHDTRDSHDYIEKALIDGFTSLGFSCKKLGVLPTPAIAFLTKDMNQLLGISISASHNPPEYNGIKFISNNALKISDKMEEEIENGFQNQSLFNTPTIKPGTIEESPALINKYINFLSGRFSANLKGINIALDLANGAAITTAPVVFKKLNAKIEELNSSPNGKNINVNCGAVHPNAVASQVTKLGYDVGISFDGDGDRVILADEKGTSLDGDSILAILARYLKVNAVVGTVMTNLGLEKFLKENGIRLIRTQVGDRFVTEAMLQNNITLGGESSGHIILRDILPTGDGLLTTLMILKIMKETNMKLSELSAGLEKTPQIMINISVRQKISLDDIPSVRDKISSAQKELAESGRLLVRYSGTENLCRVMVEAAKKELATRLADEIANAIKSSPICET